MPVLGLRARVLVLVAAAVVPAFVLLLFNSAQQRRRDANDASDHALQSARAISAQQSDLIENARGLLTTIARLPDVRSLDTQPCSTLLAGLRSQFPGYTNIW